MDDDTYQELALEVLLLQLKVIKLNLLCIAYLLTLLPNHREHRWWIRPVWRKRHLEGVFHTAMITLRVSGDIEYFLKYFRMSPAVFDYLCSRLSSRLQKFPRNREPLSPAERVAIALTFLGSGDSVKSVAMSF